MLQGGGTSVRRCVDSFYLLIVLLEDAKIIFFDRRQGLVIFCLSFTVEELSFVMFVSQLDIFEALLEFYSILGRL